LDEVRDLAPTLQCQTKPGLKGEQEAKAKVAEAKARKGVEARLKVGATKAKAAEAQARKAEEARLKVAATKFLAFRPRLLHHRLQPCLLRHLRLRRCLPARSRRRR